MSLDYVEAAMVACPRCGARAGSPCVVRACRNGYPGCDYAVCSYLKELPEPHLERAVAARREDPKLAAVEALVEHARKVSPSDSMTVYVGDLEKALGHRADSVRGIRGAES